MLTFPSKIARPRAPFLLAPLLALLAAVPAQAANFSLTSDSTTAQTLGSGSGQTGTVGSGVNLTVGGSTVAVTVTGNNATLTNLGTIKQTGTGRIVRDNTGVTSLVINNGSATNSSAVMQSADADVVQMAKSPASVTLNNWGQMISLNASAGGSQAVDFNAIVSGSNVVNNYSGALLKALEADAVRPGANGVVNNWGTILSVTTTGSSSDGVDVQNNSGVTVNNNAGIIEGGRHGITGGAVDANTPFTAMITNLLGATIQGDNGSGINLDGFNALQVVTVKNGGTIVGNGVTGDGDGVDVDGLLNLVNTGVIRSLNAVDPSATAFSEGISVGGGTITNSGLIEGLVAAGNTNAKGIGITLTGNDIQVGGKDTGARDGLYGNAVVDNQSGGVIHGGNSSAIVIKGNPSTFTATITNEAGGTIRGGGTTDAAIQAGVDPVTVNNAGLIDGGSSGRAFAGGGGNVTFTISGGAASVLGSIDGGAGTANKMTIAPGAGNTFAYASGISNFDTVEVASGTVTLSGTNTYTGTTMIDAGATLALDGAGRLAAGSKLDLEGGTLKLVDVHGANGQEFAVVSLGKDSAIDLGDSSLTFDALGNLVAGKTLTVTDYLASASPDYALRFAGDLTHDAAFLALMSDTTIDGLAASVRFQDGYTDVTAVPEPANLALLLAGVGLLGTLARRRKAAPDA